ncbi:MAG: hypothetical protein NTZ67_03585 [Gammaproteobacteria bacterium]|nr:hypothetical protein [Gammaproteobacteria bacterium]
MNIKAGDKLPSIQIKEKPIDDILSATHHTLIVCGKEKIRFQSARLKILHLPEKAYVARYILVSPDRQVLIAEDAITDDQLKSALT